MVRSENIETFFQFIIIQIIDFRKKIVHVQKVGDSLKKTVKKGAVFQKEVPEFLIDSKDTVVAAEEFKGHRGGLFFRCSPFQRSWVKRILNGFIVVSKNLLQDVHGIIMQ